MAWPGGVLTCIYRDNDELCLLSIPLYNHVGFNAASPEGLEATGNIQRWFSVNWAFIQR